MKFYSEKLNKFFDDPEQLLIEEGCEPVEYEDCEDEAEETLEETPSRKELALAIEEADKLVAEANVNYNNAKLKAEELSKKYLDEIEQILNPAKKAVKDAERARYEAIKRFNDSYNGYQVTYTSARAADEFFKALDNLNQKERIIFRNLFWF